jgi:hypothetical protein
MRNRLLCILVLVLATPALAQEHQHPPQDQALHNQFYSNWYRPDKPNMSCCSNKDCYPTEFRMQTGQWFARRREDGRWIWVPPGAFEHNRKVGIPRESPDTGSHVCMQPPGQGEMVFCAVLGIGG